MKTITLFAIMIATFSLTVKADEVSSPEDTYYQNLSFIHILLENVEFFKTACETEYPEYSEKNQAAYELWAKKYHNFVKEIDGYVNEFILESPDSLGVSHEEAKEKFAQEMNQGQQLILKSLKRYLNEERSQDFKTWCKNYPSYTQSEKTDVINTYSDRVVAMNEARLLMISDDIEENQKQERLNKTNEDDVPTVVISRDQLDDLGDMKAGDFILLVNAKIPFPKVKDSVESLIKQIEYTEKQIIEQTETSLLVQGFKDSDKSTQAFLVSYELKDGVYIKGPIMVKDFDYDPNKLDSIIID